MGKKNCTPHIPSILSVCLCSESPDNNSLTVIHTFTGLSNFFGIPIVPGHVQGQVGKSGAMFIKSRSYALPSKTEKLSLNFNF